LNCNEENIGGEKTRLILGTDNPLLEMMKGRIPESDILPAKEETP